MSTSMWITMALTSTSTRNLVIAIDRRQSQRVHLCHELASSPVRGLYSPFGIANTPGRHFMIGNILGWCIFGLIAGALARLLTPGRDPMGCLMTIGIGVAGSFLGGFVAHLLFDSSQDGVQPAGMIGSVIGGILVLLLMRKLRRPR